MPATPTLQSSLLQGISSAQAEKWCPKCRNLHQATPWPQPGCAPAPTYSHTHTRHLSDPLQPCQCGPQRRPVILGLTLPQAPPLNPKGRNFCLEFKLSLRHEEPVLDPVNTDLQSFPVGPDLFPPPRLGQRLAATRSGADWVTAAPSHMLVLIDGTIERDHDLPRVVTAFLTLESGQGDLERVSLTNDASNCAHPVLPCVPTSLTPLMPGIYNLLYLDARWGTWGAEPTVFPAGRYCLAWPWRGPAQPATLLKGGGQPLSPEASNPRKGQGTWLQM